MWEKKKKKKKDRNNVCNDNYMFMIQILYNVK